MIPPRSPRYDTLDAWRGLACVLVVLFHSNLGTTGRHDHAAAAADDSFATAAQAVVTKLWVGVPLFFVISGYCITAAADSARRRPHRGRSFFARRFRRIYPPLWAFLAACVLIHVNFQWVQSVTGLPLAISHRDPFDVSLTSWLGSVTLTEEWRCHVVGPARDYFQWHLWTLCYEEQFYFVTGLAVVLAPRRLFAVVGGVSVVVFLILADLIRPPFAIDGFFFDGSWLEFAAGVFVYHRRNYASRFTARLIDLGLLAGLVWAARSVSGWAEFKQSVPTHLTAAFAGALLIGLCERHDGLTAKWRALAPLRWCGVRCYSLYLVHGPAVYVTSRVLQHWGWTTPSAILYGVIPVCTVISLACGWAFHKFVEVHFLNAQPPKPSPSLTQTPMPSRKPASTELARV